MQRRGWWIALFGLMVVVGFGGVAAWAVLGRHTFAGEVKQPPVAAADFSLTDEAGQPFALSDLRGQWILLAYGYTTCPDVCPATLSALKRVKEQLGPQAADVRVVFVSIDPARDTVPVMENFVHHFGADFKGLTGAPEAVATAAKAFGAKYEKWDIQTSVGYLMKHSAFVYVIDPRFEWRLTFPFGVKPQEMAADLKYLMTREKK
jgi:protein SCO1/2